MNYLRGFLFDNLGLKFVALLLAVLIYLNVYTDRPATMVVSFPLQFTDLADSLSVSGSPPGSVEAELRGTGKDLIRLRLREPVLKISLANASTGRYERTLGAADLPLGESGLQVDRLIGPILLDFRIEPSVRRRVPVAARITGAPAEGHVQGGSPILDPDHLRIRGPASIVTGLDSIRLTPASVEGARDTVSLHVAPDSLPEWCTADPPTVWVVVPVVPQP